MSAVETIKAAIEELPLEERAELIAELCGWPDDEWDREMKAAAAAGKFDAMNREAEADLAGGRTRSLEDIINEP